MNDSFDLELKKKTVLAVNPLANFSEIDSDTLEGKFQASLCWLLSKFQALEKQDFSLPEAESAPQFVEFANVHRKVKTGRLTIAVLNLPGETRFPQFRSSKKLTCAYGYVEGFKSAGKAQRCYIHPDLLTDDSPARSIYAITQLSPATGEVDEIKWAIGYPNLDSARAAYQSEMPAAFFGSIREIAPADFAEGGCKVGDAVRWKWSGGAGRGRVKKIYRKPVTLKLGGSNITRNGTPDNPALLIEQSDKSRALKLQSEISRIQNEADYDEAAGEVDLSEAYEERTAIALAAAYEQSMATIAQFIEQIANSDADEATKYRNFVDGLADLNLNAEAIAQVLGDGLTASYFAGMYSERIDP